MLRGSRSAESGVGTPRGEPSHGASTVQTVPEPVPLTSSLDAMMRSLRGTDRLQVSGVFGKWDEAVGPSVAAHLRPVKLDRGVLLVEADEPAWATQAKFLADTIVDRLRAVAGVEVERVEVRVARGS